MHYGWASGSTFSWLTRTDIVTLSVGVTSLQHIYIYSHANLCQLKSNMNNSTVISILDLSDEILLTIFKKLNNVDVLYSLVGVNKKLDKLIRDVVFTRSLDFVATLSNEENDSRINSILDRFCIDYYLKFNTISNVLLWNHHW